VRVASVQNVAPWTKAGFVICQSLAAFSRHAAIFATPAATHGLAFQSRLQDGGLTTHVAGPALAPPVWLRLQRRGDTITAFSRPTTADPWLEVGTRTLSGLLDPVYVGAALTSHRTDVLAMAPFEGLTLTPVAAGKPSLVLKSPNDLRDGNPSRVTGWGALRSRSTTTDERWAKDGVYWGILCTTSEPSSDRG
jgi:hypothetical protein